MLTQFGDYFCTAYYRRFSFNSQNSHGAFKTFGNLILSWTYFFLNLFYRFIPEFWFLICFDQFSFHIIWFKLIRLLQHRKEKKNIEESFYFVSFLQQLETHLIIRSGNLIELCKPSKKQTYTLPQQNSRCYCPNYKNSKGIRNQKMI